MKKILLIFLFLFSNSTFSGVANSERKSQEKAIGACECIFIEIDSKRSKCVPESKFKNDRRCSNICKKATRAGRNKETSERMILCKLK